MQTPAQFTSDVNATILNHRSELLLMTYRINWSNCVFMFLLAFLISVTDTQQTSNFCLQKLIPTFFGPFTLQSWQMDACAILCWCFGNKSKIWSTKMKQVSIQPNQKWLCEHSPEGEGRSIKFEFGPSNQTKCQSTLILLAILGVLLVNKSSPKSQVSRRPHQIFFQAFTLYCSK